MKTKIELLADKFCDFLDSKVFDYCGLACMIGLLAVITYHTIGKIIGQ